MSSTRITLQLRLPHEAAGRRFDQALSEALPEHSRSRLRKWLDAGHVLMDGQAPRAKDRVAGGELVQIDAPVEDAVQAAAEPMPLDIVHQDEALLVINKPAGLVVHPGAGNPGGTLMNALLAHDPALARLPRAGIVHRLDKDTSGLLVIGRSEAACAALSGQLADRSLHREYQAVCMGFMTGGGTVNAPIDRHPVDRLRMAVRSDGREAVTHYRVIERFRAHTWVRVQLETGRTHQIRLHLSHVGYPLVGDPVYGRRLLIPREATPRLDAALRGFRRQALHAARLMLEHPGGSGPLELEAPLPADLAGLLDALREDAKAGSAKR